MGVLVSEIMAQQTPLARVEPAWREWMVRWPGPADLAAASPGDVVRAWGRLGYPRRALRLREAAIAVVERHDGIVPRDEASLLALPGVGSYTAAAVAAFAYGERTVVVDTNVRRVLTRILLGRAQAAPALTRAETALAASLLPQDDGECSTWNVAVMELGALVCTARSPRCEQCPVNDLCAWNAAGRPPTTGHPGEARPMRAPIARSVATSSSCCGMPRNRWGARHSRSSTRTPLGWTAASTRSSPTASSSRCPVPATASRRDDPADEMT